MALEVTVRRPRFAFIQDDVQAQLDVSKSVLQDARKLDELINDPKTDSALREQLTKVRDNLLDQAKRLASNAATTSGSATQVFVTTSANT